MRELRKKLRTVKRLRIRSHLPDKTKKEVLMIREPLTGKGTLVMVRSEIRVEKVIRNERVTRNERTSRAEKGIKSVKVIRAERVTRSAKVIRNVKVTRGGTVIRIKKDIKNATAIIPVIAAMPVRHLLSKRETSLLQERKGTTLTGDHFLNADLQKKMKNKLARNKPTCYDATVYD